MNREITLALAALSLGTAVAQQAGTLTAEVHPKLTVSTCQAGGKCTSQQQSVVLDGNWRWLHSTSGATNCYTGNTWDATLCPDPKTCAANCAMDGANYASTYGISTSGNALSLQLVTGSNVGSRTYLMDSTDTKYQEFNLKNQEFTFDVDVSGLGCGLNGALYFVSMPADGGASLYPSNKAGAKYGTGYCDSQCPQDLKFIGGIANIAGWAGDPNNANSGTGTLGSCCNEMDIWEANSISTALTPHVCSSNAACNSDETCGAGDDRADGLCDKDGCDFNPYRQGNTTFYGPHDTIDTTKPLTVVTQFLTSDGTAAGDLVEIRRIYVQNGIVYQNPQSDVAGVPGNSITESFCTAQKTAFGDTNSFAARGGLKAMGDSFAKGMVLVMSLWDDYAVNMLWLDSDYPTTAPVSAPGVARGTCSTTSGKPGDVESQHPGSTVIYSNIRTGPINSTYSGTPANGGSGGGSSSSKAPTPPSSSTSVKPVSSATTKPVSSSTPVTSVKVSSTSVKSSVAASPTAVAQHYAQCGGQGWTGPTVCASPYTCKASGQYYSQCL